MRKLVPLFKASYHFMLVLLVCCVPASGGYCQQATGDNTLPEEQNLNFCFPQTNEIKYSVLTLKKNTTTTGPYLYILAADLKMPTGEKNLYSSNYMASVTSDSLKTNDSMAATTGETDSVDTKDANNTRQKTNDVAGTDYSPLKSTASLFDDEADLLANKYAQMISVEPEDVNNFSLYKFIDQWYGTRYKYGGTDNTGIDCSAFAQKLYGSIYSTPLLRTCREQHKNCEIIKDSDEAMEGDLIFFRINRIRVSHVGVYLANGYFVHASRSHGVTISSLNDKYWLRRYAGCGRMSREDKPTTESDYLQ